MLALTLMFPSGGDGVVWLLPQLLWESRARQELIHPHSHQQK